MSSGFVLAIDPGPTESAYVFWDGTRPRMFGKCDNDVVIGILRDFTPGHTLVIEQIASYGMAVGAEVFETCFWSGRFAEAFAGPVDRIPRLRVKLHLCGDSRAKDTNIRQALIDRYGAPGTKKDPGVLYGVKSDIWSALAVAATWWDTRHIREALKSA